MNYPVTHTMWQEAHQLVGASETLATQLENPSDILHIIGMVILRQPLADLFDSM